MNRHNPSTQADKPKSGYLRGFIPAATPGILAAGLSALGASVNTLLTAGAVTAGLAAAGTALGALGIYAVVSGAPFLSARQKWKSYFSTLKGTAADIVLGSERKELGYQRPCSLVNVCAGAFTGASLSVAMSYVAVENASQDMHASSAKATSCTMQMKNASAVLTSNFAVTAQGKLEPLPASDCQYHMLVVPAKKPAPVIS